MLFLVSGASGVGKSTVREHLTPRLGPAFVAVELRDLASTEAVTVRPRQETAEVAAARAAARVGGIAVCLLDASPRAQADRLAARGDDPALLDAHHGFAQWMREHATDPLPRLDVLTRDGAPGARWKRVARLVEQDQWRVTVADTSRRRTTSELEP